jgi:NTP pyrophosphatase (non-canonical NTP hydrolase)
MSGSGDFSIGGTVWPGLSKLIEECGEVQQVCGKLLGSRGEENHWDGSNLRERLQEELGDLVAAINFVIQKNGLDICTVACRSDDKLQLFNDWHADALRDVMGQALDAISRLRNLDDGASSRPHRERSTGRTP